MRTGVVICVVAAAASLSAAQGGLGRSVPDRDRREAQQHYRLGQDALHGERFDVAEDEFQKAAKLDPTLELAPYGLGQVYMATKRYPSAVIAFQKSREVFQANAVALAGDAMARERRIDDQIKELEDQQRLYQQPGRNPNTMTAQNQMQQIDLQIHAMKDARRRTATGPEPTPPWISLSLGSAYFRTDAFADAEREYRAAIAVEPKLGEAHNNLAVIYMLTRRFPEAEQEVKAAEKSGFKVNPQFKEDLKKAASGR
jgi:Flp pilus assembly protein TadD